MIDTDALLVRLRTVCGTEEEYQRRQQAAITHSFASAIPIGDALQIEIEHVIRGI